MLDKLFVFVVIGNLESISFHTLDCVACSCCSINYKGSSHNCRFRPHTPLFNYLLPTLPFSTLLLLLLLLLHLNQNSNIPVSFFQLSNLQIRDPLYLNDCLFYYVMDKNCFIFRVLLLLLLLCNMVWVQLPAIIYCSFLRIFGLYFSSQYVS